MPFPNHRSGGGSVPLTHGDSWQGLVSTEANLLHQRKPNKLQERRFQTSVKTYRHAARHILMCVVTGSNYSCEDGGLGGFGFGSLCVTTALLKIHILYWLMKSPRRHHERSKVMRPHVSALVFFFWKKKKKSQEQHPSLENVILLYSSNCKQQSIFYKNTH